jgi:hypothetical protein
MLLIKTHTHFFIGIMIMSDKVNGYQIRTDLLHLATRIVEEQSQTQLKLFEAKLHMAKSLEDLAKLNAPANTIEEILSVADKLNQFVQTK